MLFLASGEAFEQLKQAKKYAEDILENFAAQFENIFESQFSARDFKEVLKYILMTVEKDQENVEYKLNELLQQAANSSYHEPN